MNGRVQYTNSTTGSFTNGQSYDLLTVGPASVAQPSAFGVVLDDAGQPHAVEIPSSGFVVTELYGSAKVV